LVASFFTVTRGTGPGSSPVWHPDTNKEKTIKAVSFPEKDLYICKIPRMRFLLKARTQCLYFFVFVATVSL
jgi:hypothetical protein